MFSEPTYLVQVGFQGKNRAEIAMRNGYADGVILSPSDYSRQNLREIKRVAEQNNGYILFDPQYYVPSEEARDHLEGFEYYSQYGGSDYHAGILYDQSTREDFSRLVIDAQDAFDVTAYISPAIYLESISEADINDWADLSETFLEVAKDYGDDLPVFLSLPINGFQLNDDDQRSMLLTRTTGLDPTGFYVSAQYSDNEVRLPLKGEENVYSYLELCLTLRANRFEVIASHTHQIAHLLLGTGINAFSSGHFQNLQTFDTSRWYPTPDDEIRQRVPRYYSDNLLDSIRPTGLVDELYEEDAKGNFSISKIRMNSPFEDDLFESTNMTPAETGWDYSDASWEHYIWSFGQLADEYRGLDIDARISTARNKVSDAKDLCDEVNRVVGETGEIDSSFYEDWENAINRLESSRQFNIVRNIAN